MTADRQKGCLKNETETDRKKVEAHRPKNSTAHLVESVRDRHEKADRRKNEKISIHGEPSILDTPAPLAMLPRRRNSPRR
jgi:hypothetical protein